MSVKLAVDIAIIEQGQVLLVQREDYEVWCLPGGVVDPGESLAQAAVREAREETGLEVELNRLVGTYSEIRDGMDVHLITFAGQAVGGQLRAQPEEVIDLRYFSPDDLPEYMFWWHRQQVTDAFNGVGGSVAWRQHIHPPQRITSGQELYDLRDQTGLERREFYRYFFESGGVDDVELEVGGTD